MIRKICLIIISFCLSFVLFVACGEKAEETKPAEGVEAVKTEGLKTGVKAPADKEKAEVKEEIKKEETEEEAKLSAKVREFLATLDGKTIVTINEKAITDIDIQREIDLEKEMLQYQKAALGETPGESKADIGDKTDKEFFDSALERLFSFELAYQLAQAGDRKADPEILEAQFNSMKESVPDFDDFLKEYKLSSDEFKKRIEQFLLVEDWVQNDIAKNIIITDEEIKKQYEEIKENFRAIPEISVSHILIKASTDEEKKAAKTKIEEALAKLNKGEKFEDLVITYSDDETANENKGSLGRISYGMAVPAFADAAFKLEKKGDLSSLVETEYGFHIIRLDEIFESGYIPLEELKNEIQDSLFNVKVMEESEKKIAAEMMKAKIEFVNPELAPK